MILEPEFPLPHLKKYLKGVIIGEEPLIVLAGERGFELKAKIDIISIT